MINKFILTLSLVGSLAWAAQTNLTTDVVKIGRKSAGIKTIIFDNNAGTSNPKLRWNNGTSKIEISLDGTTWLGLATGTAIDYTGTLFDSALATCPTGSLLADGSAISRTTYLNLFGKLGITQGQGDGTTTFNVTDMRGRFKRTLDGAAGNDPDKLTRTAMATGGNTGNAVGSVQTQATKKNGLTLSDPGHQHLQTYPTANGAFANYGNSNTCTFTSCANGTSSGGIGTASATSNVTLGAGDNETRPANVNVLTCIVY